MPVSRTRLFALLALVAVPGPAACANGTPASSGNATGERITLRLAHFPNLTHAPAIYGLEKDIFAESLGDDVTIDVKTFGAGPDVITGMFADDIDIAYVGPNPAVNGFRQSDGEAVRVIAGATSGGASLVVRPEIASPDQLEGTTLSTPSLGNTQDVALRAWLAGRGLNATGEDGGDVSIRPQENARTLQAFIDRRIDGAWVPQPWARRLVLEGGGKVIVDEATLWPGGKYATTVVIVRKRFLDEHPGVVESFLRAHVRVIEEMTDDEDESHRVVNTGIEGITGAALAGNVLEAAWGDLEFTYDPLIGSIERSATAAENVDLLDDDAIEGIENLTLLNRVLEAEGKEQVES